MDEKQKRWMRFSTRDLFWLALVVGLIIGWAIDHWRLLREWSADYVKLREAQITIRELIGQDR